MMDLLRSSLFLLLWPRFTTGQQVIHIASNSDKLQDPSSYTLQIVFDMTGDYHLANKNGSIAVNCTVPGMVHTDLLAAGIIDEPYNQYNDANLSWIPAQDWYYNYTFVPTPQLLALRYVDIVFEGLITVADVYLNGQLVLTANNMFRKWTAPVKALLQPQANNMLLVAFSSSLAVAQELDHQYNMSTHNITNCPAPQEHGYCYRNFVRQTPCFFSWDFAPAFPTNGIYKPVYLVGYSSIVLQGAVVRTGVAHGQALPLAPGHASAWDIHVTMWVDSPTSVAAARARLVIPALGVDASVPFALDGASSWHVVNITVPNVTAQAWWPRAFAAVGGAPVLYNASVSLVAAADTWRQSIQIGFRVVDLVQAPLPAGTSFKFTVNGAPFYAKGSNFVPADTFESRLTSDNLTALFDAFEAADFNLVRAWGGGLYQRDEFFQMADARGIFIWQEFSLANAYYPTDAAFLGNLALEVRDQVVRLASHPSLLLYNANNEIGRILSRKHAANPTDPAFPYFVDDYVTVMYDTVLTHLAAWDATALYRGGAGGTRPALPTSPSLGNNTRSYPIPWEPTMFYDGLMQGDFHGYLYTIDCWDTSNYPRTRFTTEFGLQSWPSMVTMRAWSNVTDAQASNWDDAFWTFRNHHPQGQQQMEFFVAQHYAPPPKSDVTAWLWMTQVTQSYCIRQQTEHYRRIQDECQNTTDGAGCNAGAMYWQANDMWPGPSWASIEYGGRWKALHHAATHFFAPFLVSALLDSNLARGGVYVVNDDPGSGRTGQVELTLVSWVAGPVATLPYNFSIGPATAARVTNFTVAELLSHGIGACPKPSACFLTYATANVLPPPPPPLSPPGQSFLLLGNLTADQASLNDPHLTITSVVPGAGPRDFVVSFTGDAPAAFVWLETPLRGVWDDNAFVYVPGLVAPPSVLWHAAPDGATPSVSQLRASLTIWSYYDVWAGRSLGGRAGKKM